MLVVDASCLYDVVVGGREAEAVRARLLADSDQVAPHLVDVEVMSVIRRDLLLGRLDRTAADQAVEDLRDWPGERFSHRPLLARAWELRDKIRSWDAVYVALAEALGAVLLTLDGRLAAAARSYCEIEQAGS